ncbi:nucleotidyltransferase family protein [Paraburkholderia dinghuensis]|uniref:Nucleotidyl transferase n=1 Tax=Paraburkholderia dinghuensis TaxID=2305225 RepID=A0A3N6MX69_9BURK|nr:nucleotidyltransferase family protein [Paraburkholderia dinghuensis]RQH08349.1 nucleotidyl transferase [Paraburkholderia dinghuensis]
MTLPVAILAGGLATRLRPITEKIPKALVDVAGEPFVFRQLRYLRDQGIRRVVLCVGFLGELVQDAVGDGSQFDIDVAYSTDGDILLGTGGALKRALPLLGEHFFVLYGDSFLPVDFAPIEIAFMASGKKALMTVLKNEDRWDKSNVLFRDGNLVEYNKRDPRLEMEYIDYGLGALDGGALDTYPDDKPFDLADVYHTLSLEHQLAGYEVHQRFYEIGSHSGLKEAEMFFSRRVG